MGLAWPAAGPPGHQAYRVSVVAGTMTAVQNGLASFDRVLDLLDRPTMRELSPGRLKIDGDAVVGAGLDGEAPLRPAAVRLPIRFQRDRCRCLAQVPDQFLVETTS